MLLVLLLLTCCPNAALTDDTNGAALRSQVSAAVAGATVTLSAGTYTVTSPITIDKALTIQGAGSAATFIQSGASAATATSSLFRVAPAAASSNVTLSNMTMRFARNSTAAVDGSRYPGGAILSDSTYGSTILNITNCTVSDSTTINGDGGGIAVRRGTLNITDSTISSNSAADGAGGGVFAGAGTTLTISGSTISGNQATGKIGDGGGLCLLGPGDGTATSSIANTSITGNRAAYDGAGIYTTAPLTINNVSYGGNLAGRYANDLWNDSGTYAADDVAPAVTLAATGSYTEGAGPQALDPALTITDSDNMYLASAVVVLENTPDGTAESLVVDVSGTGIVANPSRGAGNSSYSITLSQPDRIDNYQTVLRTIKYANTSENPSITLRTVSFKVNDAGQDSVVRSHSLALSRVNDPPTVSFTQASYTAVEQANLNLYATGISIADLDAASGSVTATLTVTEGILTASAGTSGATATNSGTSAVTLNGSVAQINAFLAGTGGATLVYFNGSDAPAATVTLTLQVNDNGNTGGAVQSGSGSRSITVTPVNDPPLLAVNAGLTLYQNAGQTIIDSGKLQLSDPDNPAADSLFYTLSAVPAKGTLKKNGTPLVVGNSFTRADIENNTISFTPNGIDEGPDSFSFTYSDGIITTPLGPGVFTFSITPVFTLSVQKIGSGAGIVTATGCSLEWNGDTGTCTLLVAAPVTISAFAEAGSVFIEWGKTFGAASVCSGTADCSFVLSEDSGIDAIFLPKYSVIPAAGLHGSISPATPLAVIEGESAQFTILPAAGYHVITPVGGSCGGIDSGNPYDTTSGITYTTNAISAGCTVQAAFRPNSSIPPFNGLVAWYPLDAESWDHSDNNNHGAANGVLNGPAAPVPDRFGNPTFAYGFDGSDDDIAIPHSDSLVVTDGFSASFWVRFNQVNRIDDGFDWQALFTKDGYSTFGLMLSTEPDPGYSMLPILRFYYSGMTPSQSDYIWDAQPNIWYHVAVTLGNGRARHYINGVIAAETFVSGALPGNLNNLLIGRSNTDYTYPLDGRLDDLRFYNRALSGDEVRDIFNVQAPVSINAAAAYSRSATVSLTLFCPDAGGCSDMQFSNDNIEWSAVEPYGDTKEWILASGDGTRSVYARFRDSQGNWTSIFSDSIVIDTAAASTTALFPSGPYASERTASLACNDGAGSGCATIYYTVDGSAPTPSSNLYSAPIPINDAAMTIRFFAVDKAGNSEAPQAKQYSPFPQVSTGVYHACGVRTDSAVVCWGDNNSGQSNPPAGTFTNVGAGYYHSCGIKSDGSLSCWGGGYNSQTSSPSGTFLGIGVGVFHSCAVRTDGTVACWGAGTTTTGNPDYGQSIPPEGTFRQVAAGVFHSCGVRTDGIIACWGYDAYGQSTPPAGTFLDVSAGGSHSCGLRTDGTIACWGENIHGQADPPAGTFLGVSAGGNHSCGVRTDGTVACWGFNDSGQATPPAGTFLEVSAKYYDTCGVRADGTAACWGDNSAGQAPVVSIAPLTLPNGRYGSLFSQAITASGGKAPYTYRVASGTLPAGISLSEAGLLHGSPTSVGGYPVSVESLDATGLFIGSHAYTLTIDKGISSTIVGSSPSPSTYGLNVVLAAWVTSGATGTVTFSEGGTVLCAAVPISNSSMAMCATSILTGGSHSITATYSGDGFYESSSGTVEHSVTPATVSLSIVFAGDGGNKVESTTPDSSINCFKGSSSGCSASFTTGLPVTLSATPDWKSIFAGWSGNAPAGVVTMDSDKSVTATFDAINKAKLLQAGTHQASIQDAYDAAISGDTILAQAYFFQEPQGVTLGSLSPKTITIKGGYADNAYVAVSGVTTVRGPVKIQSGKLIVERLKIKTP